MTDIEVMNIIKSERERLISLLPHLDPLRENHVYRTTLENIQQLGWLAPHEPCAVCTCEPKVPVNEEPYVEPTPFPEPSAEEYTAPVMEAAVTTTEIADSGPTTDKLGVPAKTYTMTEVRAALAQSRKKGVNVTELMKDLGYDNFTAVPAAKYPELMARLESL